MVVALPSYVYDVLAVVLPFFVFASVCLSMHLLCDVLFCGSLNFCVCIVCVCVCAVFILSCDVVG